MADTSRFALDSAASPDRLMEGLETFIEFWLGPRRAEFGEPEDGLEGHRLPGPLRRLYAFAGRWTRPHPDVAEEAGIFSISDHLRPPDRLERTSDGKLIFLDENQGNWACATSPEGDDPPVWVEDVFDLYGQGEWGLVPDPLSRFLVTFCLKELLFGSVLLLDDTTLERWFESSESWVVPLWTGGQYPNWDGTFDFYLMHDSVLVGNLGGGLWFGANHEEGIRLLTAHQGQIRQVGLALESSWSLSIGPDGSASVTLPNYFDSTALIPPGTFDFASVQDQLRAVCTKSAPRQNPWYATFLRSGQTSCRGMGVEDARLAATIFRRALAAVATKDTDFDGLMSRFPPQF